jgi:hypothetical protein
VRKSAANALGSLGAEAKDAIPDLTRLTLPTKVMLDASYDTARTWDWSLEKPGRGAIHNL